MDPITSSSSTDSYWYSQMVIDAQNADTTLDGLATASDEYNDAMGYDATAEVQNSIESNGTVGDSEGFDEAMSSEQSCSPDCQAPK